MRFEKPVWVDEMPSTNTPLIEKIERGEPLHDGYVLATHWQTAGRGQGDRIWIARPGRDLCFSFAIQTNTPMRQLTSLSMAAALAVAECVESLGVSQPQTKWPNDAQVQGRKIAGILPELPEGDADTQRTVVVGVGLNVRMTEQEADEIDQPATSLFVETGNKFSPVHVLPDLLNMLEARLAVWSEHGFAGLREDWHNRCVGVGEQVVVKEGSEWLTGVLSGFGDAGQLLLDDGGPVREVWSGRLRTAG
ncbi:MAG: biotin--[acetyl-CoA-carboxylase] ligase [Candidatus Latescibacterota bacterium]|nr:biotin--[acetyl-CoA-carboxylase] ligase [Candidatus Latescibacterota bacterium]